MLRENGSDGISDGLPSCIVYRKESIQKADCLNASQDERAAWIDQQRLFHKIGIYIRSGERYGVACRCEPTWLLFHIVDTVTKEIGELCIQYKGSKYTRLGGYTDVPDRGVFVDVLRSGGQLPS